MGKMVCMTALHINHTCGTFTTFGIIRTPGSETKETPEQLLHMLIFQHLIKVLRRYMLISSIFVTQKHSQRFIWKYIWQEIFNKATYASQNKSCLKILCI